MKHLYFMLALLTMISNIFLTIYLAKMKGSKKRGGSYGSDDIVTFYLPGRETAGQNTNPASKCEDTVPLE